MRLTINRFYNINHVSHKGVTFLNRKKNTENSICCFNSHLHEHRIRYKKLYRWGNRSIGNLIYHCRIDTFCRSIDIFGMVLVLLNNTLFHGVGKNKINFQWIETVSEWLGMHSNRTITIAMIVLELFQSFQVELIENLLIFYI